MRFKQIYHFGGAILVPAWGQLSNLNSIKEMVPFGVRNIVVSGGEVLQLHLRGTKITHWESLNVI